MAGGVLKPTFFSEEEICDSCGNHCERSTIPPEVVRVRQAGGRFKSAMLCAKCYRVHEEDERRIKQEEAARRKSELAAIGKEKDAANVPELP